MEVKKISMANKNISLRIINFFKFATVFFFVAMCGITAVSAAIYVPTFHLDGAFQTASSLFRIESGQFPGRDFYPYLGVGPLLAIFPIYKIFGGDLAATVAAAKFLTIFLSWMALSTICHFVFRPLNVINSIIFGGLILFGVNFFTINYYLNNVLAFGFDPGNSLRPVRAVIPYLIAASIYFLIKNINRVNFRDFLISVCLGLSLLWSNDFSIPTFGIFVMFVGFYKYFFEKSWLFSTLIIFISSIAIGVFFLFLVTAGHPLNVIKYNFNDVAKDQWWYFGPYGESSRIFRISQLPRIFSQENYFSIVVLIGTFLIAIKTRLIEDWFVFTIGLTLFAGGSLASIGGHLGGYFSGLNFWGGGASLILCFKAFTTIASRGKLYYYFVRGSGSGSGSGVFSLIVIGIIFGISLKDYKIKLKMVQADPGRFYVNEFGGYLDVEFRDYIDHARKNRNYVAVEDYWGLWNSLNRRFPPWPVDSVIHALGDVRGISRHSIKQADFMITTRYSTSQEWQPWNISQNYWFYEDLISNWEPILKSPTTIVWKRSATRSSFENIKCQVSKDKLSIILPQAPSGFYRLTLEYSSNAEAGRHILMFKNNISFGSDARGFVSIEPGSHTTNFPVFKSQDSDEFFNLKVIGKAHAEISSCFADRILYENDELLRVFKEEDFFITNSNWVKGVAIKWAGFFTSNADENKDKFQVGSIVTFQNGEKRSIASVKENGIYLNVWVDGEILIQKNVGIPSKFEVEK